MKATFYHVFLFFAGILCSSYISGQTGMNEADSVPIAKPERLENLYKFFNNGDKEIKYKNLKKELVSYTQYPIWKDIGNNFMTRFTGYGFTSSADAYWKTSGKINCNDSLPDWNIDLYCEGSIEKQRERVQNDDGSWSVETIETNLYYWDKNAGGFLLEDNDTIAFFSLIMNPRENELLRNLCSSVLPPVDTASGIKISASWRPTPSDDFGVIGNIRGKDLIIIHDGTDHKAWIYINNLFTCMFQFDLDYPGLRKKYIIMPYLLVNKNIPTHDRTDLFRLAIVSRLLSVSISPGY